MADNLQKYLKHLDNMLQDNAQKLEPDDKSRTLSQAVLLYSKDKPYLKLKEEDGDGATYDFSLPSDWIEGFSYIDGEIEYPSDYAQSVYYVDDTTWRFYSKIVSTLKTTYIRFITFIPASGKSLRYTYACPHTLNKETCTIFEIDFEAVTSLAAALCFWALAAKFAQTSDSSIEADVVDYQRISDMYTELAKNKMAYYNTLMGKGSGKEGDSLAAANAGVSVKDFDMTMTGGDDFLGHPSDTH